MIISSVTKKKRNSVLGTNPRTRTKNNKNRFFIILEEQNQDWEYEINVFEEQRIEQKQNSLKLKDQKTKRESSNENIEKWEKL